MKKIMTSWLLLTVLIFGGYSLSANAEEVCSTYISPQGIEFVSQTNAWDEAKLAALNDVFMTNIHREEIHLLKRIILSPEHPSTLLGKIDLAISRNLFLNPTGITPGRTITLYYADKFNTPESLATTLAHEYGHLFTYYHLMKKEHMYPDSPETMWAKLRFQTKDKVNFYQSASSDVSEDPKEILADDYIALFGGAEAKRGLYEDGYKIRPATKVPGLREYWLNAAEFNAGSSSRDENGSWISDIFNSISKISAAIFSDYAPVS